MTFIKLFKAILSADKDVSRQAAREVRKFLYSSRSSQNDLKSIASIVEDAPTEYAKIEDDWRQENFVMAVSVIYYLHNRENQPDFLFSWLFQLLQHKNGNIRHAAVRMVQSELGPLTYHIRFPNEKLTRPELSKEKADGILLGLRANLSNLEENSWKNSYRKFKYIDELPSGTHKSVQLILSLLDDYCSDVARTETQIESKQQILERRGEIEKELSDMLKKTGSGFWLKDIKELIYNGEDNNDFHRLIAMFDRGGDASELNNILELASNAWNYFPHKNLGGISPAEKLLQYHPRTI